MYYYFKIDLTVLIFILKNEIKSKQKRFTSENTRNNDTHTVYISHFKIKYVFVFWVYV